MGELRKKEGFDGQRAIVLPKKIVEVCGYTPPLNSLYVTDIGFYPRASHHYRERHSGITQNIMIYCTEGRGWVEIPSGTYEVNPNEFLVIPADVPHKYGAHDNIPWTIYWAHFKGTMSPSFVSLLSRQFKSYVNPSPFLEDRIKIFDSVYKNLEAGYSLDNLAYCNLSFQYFLTTLCFAEKLLTAHQTFEKDAVDISIEYMQYNLDCAFTLEALAQSVNLSTSHYSNIFKKKTGYSPITYFNHLKVQRACQYLQFTSLRINEIGMKLGIPDPYYFSRMFTKIMGVSPADYRKKKYSIASTKS